MVSVIWNGTRGPEVMKLPIQRENLPPLLKLWQAAGAFAINVHPVVTEDCDSNIEPPARGHNGTPKISIGGIL